MHHVHLAHYIITETFIESNRRYDRTGCGIRNAQHIEIALQLTVLSWRAMYYDKYAIEINFFPLVGATKIVFINIDFLAIGEGHEPTILTDNHLIYIIPFRIEVGHYGSHRTHGDDRFARISTCQYCNVFRVHLSEKN